MKPQTLPRSAVFSTTALLALVLLLTVPVLAHADRLYEYTYTGQPFTSAYGPFFPGPPADYRVTISFTYGDLVPNIDYTRLWPDSDPEPITFTISADDFSLVGEFPYGHVAAQMIFYALADGLPTQWIVAALDADLFPDDVRIESLNTASSVYDKAIFKLLDLWPPSPFPPVILDTAGSNSNAPGTWTRMPIPEPSSLLLMGLGLAGLAGLGWRRKRQ